MLKKYNDKFPPYDLKTAPDELLNAGRAAVFARIGTEDIIKTRDSEFEKKFGVSAEPQELRAVKRSPLKTIIPIAAAAAVAVAAVPVGIKLLNGRAAFSGAGNASSEYTEPVSAQSENASAVGGNALSEEDIKYIQTQLENRGQPFYDAKIIDLDSDGSDELIVLTAEANARSFGVYRKRGGELINDSSFGAGKLNYIDRIALTEAEVNGERMFLFSFGYDGGTMKADEVLAAVKMKDGAFDVEYLLSHGTLSYSDIEEPFSREFFREGWNRFDIGMEIGAEHGDITEEQYNEIYNSYLSGIKTESTDGRAVPALSEVSAMTEFEAVAALKGFTADMLIAAWGEPDASLSGFYGHIWNCNDSEIVVYFDAESRAEHVKVGAKTITSVMPVISIEDRVSNALLGYLKKSYLNGACPAEGHIILDVTEDDEGCTVTALTVCGFYEQNGGNYEKISGSSPTPALLRFDADSDGELVLKEMIFPEESADHRDEVKRLFPEHYDRCAEISAADLDELERQMTAYAERFFNAEAIPTLEELAMMSAYHATNALKGVPAEKLNAAWGEPSEQLSGMFGLVWKCNDMSIIVYFDADSRADHVNVDTNGYDPSAGPTAFSEYDEQIEKYEKMLPTGYSDIPQDMICGVITDKRGLMVSHRKFVGPDGSAVVLTDSDGRMFPTLDFLVTRDAEIVFKNGSAAEESDLSPGTVVLVAYDMRIETYPSELHCTKIIIQR